MSFETPCFENVNVGDALPPLAIEITPSLIVGGAIASRDFTPVHHDAAAARAQGMQNVFMNILTTNGLVGRFISDWAGPNALIRQVKIRLGTPNLPGDTMTLVGSVTSVEGDVVEVEVAGKNSWGNHVTGTVRVALPQ
jgi:acyl dehydratase